MLASALLSIAMTSTYPGPIFPATWLPWSNLPSMAGTVTPESQDVREHQVFNNRLTASDLDEFRRQTGAETFEVKAHASTAHRGEIFRITSASYSGPLVLTGFVEPTGTFTYLHTKVAIDTGVEPFLIKYDEYRLVDGALNPLLRDATVYLGAVVIIMGDKVPAPPGDPLPPGPVGGPSGGRP
jgi:hypothetical protein